MENEKKKNLAHPILLVCRWILGGDILFTLKTSSESNVLWLPSAVWLRKSHQAQVTASLKSTIIKLFSGDTSELIKLSPLGKIIKKDQQM